eukprot:364710-Chlamydomonas_euryale.AAC.5
MPGVKASRDAAGALPRTRHERRPTAGLGFRCNGKLCRVLSRARRRRANRCMSYRRAGCSPTSDVFVVTSDDHERPGGSGGNEVDAADP